MLDLQTRRGGDVMILRMNEVLKGELRYNTGKIIGAIECTKK
ncbi:hypothetical protein MTLP_05050 [Candidatus Methanoliparum sp. LAM-1]|nr:hypothetical protein MTLP_05050 [Candidatus Methanoliparum sp. LAM-1]